MRPPLSSITNRRGSVTKRRRSTPLDGQNGNLTPLHFQILQWVESRQPGDKRPQIEGLSAFSLDTAVAELVLRDLIKAVSIPQRRYDRAHWEPTGLTATGWRTLMKNRRSKPQPVTHPWWRLRLWG
jgi:hypothetical protein